MYILGSGISVRQEFLAALDQNSPQRLVTLTGCVKPRLAWTTTHRHVYICMYICTHIFIFGSIAVEMLYTVLSDSVRTESLECEG